MSIEIEPPSWRQQQPAWSTQRSSIHVTPLEVALKPAPCADNLADEAYIYSSRLQRDARRVCAASTLLPPATPDPCCGCPPAGGGSIMLVNRRCSVDVDCVYQPWLWAVGKLTISRFEACHAWQRQCAHAQKRFRGKLPYVWLKVVNTQTTRSHSHSTGQKSTKVPRTTSLSGPVV